MGSSYSCAKAFCGSESGLPDEYNAVRSQKQLGHVQQALDSLLSVRDGEGATASAQPLRGRASDDAPMLVGPRSDEEGPVKAGCSKAGCSRTLQGYEAFLASRLEMLAFIVSVLAALTGDMYIPLIPLHFADSGLPVGDAARVSCCCLPHFESAAS